MLRNISQGTGRCYWVGQRRILLLHASCINFTNWSSFIKSLKSIRYNLTKICRLQLILDLDFIFSHIYLVQFFASTIGRKWKLLYAGNLTLSMESGGMPQIWCEDGMMGISKLTMITSKPEKMHLIKLSCPRIYFACF